MSLAITGAILIGGRARRMGGLPKGLIRVGTQTIVGRLSTVLKTRCTDVYWIGDPDGAYARHGYPIFPDEIPNRGAPGGVYSALHHARTDWVFVLACDLPQFDLPAFEKFQPNPWADAILPRTPHGAQPLAGLWHKRCLPVIKERFEKGQPGFAEITECLSVDWIECEEDAYINLNTEVDAMRAGAVLPES